MSPLEVARPGTPPAQRFRITIMHHVVYVCLLIRHLIHTNLKIILQNLCILAPPRNLGGAAMFRLTCRRSTTAAAAVVPSAAKRLRGTGKPTIPGPTAAWRTGQSRSASSSSSSSQPAAAGGRGPAQTSFGFWGTVAATGVASLSLGLFLGSKPGSDPRAGAIQYASRDTMLKVGGICPPQIVPYYYIPLTRDASRLCVRSRRHWEKTLLVSMGMPLRHMDIRTGPRPTPPDGLWPLSIPKRQRMSPKSPKSAQSTTFRWVSKVEAQGQ